MLPSLLLLLCFFLLPQICPAQQSVSETARPWHSHIGIGVTMSTLGAGIELAKPLTERSNLRTSFNMFIYSRPFDTSGITYNGELSLRSAELAYDWFPFRNGFHLSPGLLVYDGNKITAKLFVPAGQAFSMDHKDYRSDSQDPIAGNATITFRKVAPAFLIGWGNLIPRKPRHFSIPFEFGVVFHGQPTLAFNMTGKGCDLQVYSCVSINNDPTAIQDIADERAKIKEELSDFKFYPVISIGFGYSF